MARLDAFAKPSPLTNSYLVEMSEIARICWMRQWTPGTAGNFSVRHQDLVWSSPSGVDKGSLSPRRFVAAALATGKPLNSCGLKPSLELSVHRGLYKSFPSIQAIVHAHSPHAVRLFKKTSKLTFQNQEILKAVGCVSPNEKLVIEAIENFEPKAFSKYADPKYLKKGLTHRKPFVVLAGHGIYAGGKTPSDALALLEGLEFLFQTVGE